MRMLGLSKRELEMMELVWNRSPISIREIQEGLREPRPAYNTVQTTVYRMEAKGAVRRVRKIGNAHVFEAAVSRNAAQRGLVDQVLGFFGGSIQPVMAQWFESRQITPAEIEEAEAMFKQLAAARGARGARVRTLSQPGPAAAPATRGGRAALPEAKPARRACEIPHGVERPVAAPPPPESEFGAAPATHASAWGSRGPHAGACVSGARGAAALGPAPTLKRGKKS